MARPNAVFKASYNAGLDLLAGADRLPPDGELGQRLGVSRTTVRSVVARMRATGILPGEGRSRTILRAPEGGDYFPADETSPVSAQVERAFLRRVFSAEARPGSLISEADLAREIGVSTSAVREFLIRFGRYGLIEKRRNRQWVLQGFNAAFALDLFDVREMFEVRAALAFVGLPDGHPAWAELARLEAEHHALLARPDSPGSAFSDLDDRFHRLVQSAAGNRFIDDFYDVISLVFHYHYLWNRAGQAERNRVAVEEHLAYIAGLRSRSAIDAEYFCRKHLASAKRTLLASIERAETERR